MWFLPLRFCFSAAGSLNDKERRLNIRDSSLLTSGSIGIFVVGSYLIKCFTCRLLLLPMCRIMGNCSNPVRHRAWSYIFVLNIIIVEIIDHLDGQLPYVLDDFMLKLLIFIRLNFCLYSSLV